MGIRKKYFILALVILFTLGVSALGFGFVPVLRIEGKNVSYIYFLKLYGAFESYDKLSRHEPVGSKEITRRAFFKIIEDKMLDILVTKTNADFMRKSEELVERAILETKNLELGEASRTLYGLSAAEFKKLVLVPQAKKDLLVKHYEYNPAELEKLWNATAQNLKVKIYYPGFYWENGEVKIK